MRCFHCGTADNVRWDKWTVWSKGNKFALWTPFHMDKFTPEDINYEVLACNKCINRMNYRHTNVPGIPAAGLTKPPTRRPR